MNAWRSTRTATDIPVITAPEERSGGTRTAILDWNQVAPPPPQRATHRSGTRPRVWAEPETQNDARDDRGTSLPDPPIVDHPTAQRLANTGLPFRQEERPRSEPPPAFVSESLLGVPVEPPPPLSTQQAEAAPVSSRALVERVGIWANGQTIGQRMQSRPPSVRPEVALTNPAGAPLEAYVSASAASNAVLVDRGAGDVFDASFAAPAREGEIPDLLWFEPKAMPRVRLWHKGLLTRQPAIGFDEKYAPTAETPADFKSRTDILAVLAHSNVERGALATLASEGLSPSGHYVAPMITVEGLLRFTFVEAEELRALVEQSELLRAGRADLGTAIDEAKRLLEGAAAASAPRMLERGARALRSKLRAAVGAEEARRIDRDVEGVLLEKRSYKKRSIMGTEWLRATLTRPTEETVAYLPSTLAERLPLFAALRCRMLAEVIPPQDQFESSPLALVTVALSRLLSPTSLGRA